MHNKDTNHPVGAGGGAAAGAAAGGLVGAAAGPIGAAIGATIGALAGAKGGEKAAEVVNPKTYDEHWQKSYKNTSYYKADRTWDDYGPAYGMGYHAKHHYRNQPFEAVESDLERTWDKTKHKSRLAWNDAKYAVRDGWHHVERALPGDFDGDGR